MLVLSRKKNESVIITVPPSTTPTTITIMNVQIKGDTCRIGLDAPKETIIHRKEVQDKLAK